MCSSFPLVCWESCVLHPGIAIFKRCTNFFTCCWRVSRSCPSICDGNGILSSLWCILGDSILVKLDILIYFQRWRRRRTRSSCRKVSFPSRYSCCSSSSCCFRVVVTHLNSASPGNLQFRCFHCKFLPSWEWLTTSDSIPSW